MTRIESAVLMGTLERVLSSYFDRQCRIVNLERYPYPYRSSYELEELTVWMEDGVTLSLLFKNLGPEGVLESAASVKPHFLVDPRREIETYRRFLTGGRFGTPIYYGAVLDQQVNSYWLFLEKVSGKELYQVGEFEHWKEAARWLARLHTDGYGAREVEQQAAAAYLLRYNGEFYAQWYHRVRATLGQKVPVQERDTWHKINRLLSCYLRGIEHLVTLPMSLIHGEFYPSNVLVHETATGLRICPVDWEMAAIGPGLMDLAALSSGSWSDARRTEIVQAYYGELTKGHEAAEPVEEFLTALDYCRLHVAIQWLGWSAVWSPPPEQAQNWLSIGLALAEKVDP